MLLVRDQIGGYRPSCLPAEVRGSLEAMYLGFNRLNGETLPSYIVLASHIGVWFAVARIQNFKPSYVHLGPPSVP